MLSLSMIVRNEAERLERCLASVAGFVDEMVVLDTGSSDATIAIAAGCGAVVHQLPWPGDFAPARNAALQHVRGDWVLVLDADEWLLSEARGPLRQLMGQSDLLLINLLRQELGAAQSPYSNVSRLFRRHPAIHWSRPYHAMVDDSVLALLEQEPHWRLADCDVPALGHDGYRSELLASGDKARRLRQAMEADLAAHPADPYACAKLGSLEVSEGKRERGIALLEQGLARCPSSSQPVRYELLLHLAIAVAGSDPARRTRGLQPQREGRVRWSAWLGGMVNTLTFLVCRSLDARTHVEQQRQNRTEQNAQLKQEDAYCNKQARHGVRPRLRDRSHDKPDADEGECALGDEHAKQMSPREAHRPPPPSATLISVVRVHGVRSAA